MKHLPRTYLTIFKSISCWRHPTFSIGIAHDCRLAHTRRGKSYSGAESIPEVVTAKERGTKSTGERGQRSTVYCSASARGARSVERVGRRESAGIFLIYSCSFACTNISAEPPKSRVEAIRKRCRKIVNLAHNSESKGDPSRRKQRSTNARYCLSGKKA